MQLVEKGSGSPVVLVPGIQGRWEWMQPAVEALARRCRVITFSLADERTCGAAFDPANGFACYVQQIADAMDASGVDRAAVCGVSYGGLIAAAFAARHPERVSSLILVSAIPHTWTPDSRARFFLRAPRLLTPLFIVGSLRMYAEIAAASNGTRQALTVSARHAMTVVTHMFSPRRMARRVGLLEDLSLEPELRRLRVPTLIITGETKLDRVVPVQSTHEYLRLWPHAEQITLANTGHIGLVTRAGEFARVVTEFVMRHASRGLKPPRYDNTSGVRSAEPSGPAIDSRRRIV